MTQDLIATVLTDPKVIRIEGESVFVEDPRKLRESAIDELVENAVFGNPAAQAQARYLIWEIGLRLGIASASIQDLYAAAGQSKYSHKTVPAINIRGLTYDVARSIFRSAMKNKVGAFIFEIARSEIGYTEQRPEEYATVLIAAAIKEGYKGPIFIQGDHFQVSAKKYQSDPAKEIAAVKDLIREAIEAGFYNIDIDTSTLVDITKQDVAEQQRLNFELSADLTAFIRSLEPQDVTVSVGGEIGEVGGKNSTIEELEAYLKNYGESLAKMGPGLTGLSKISVQTGTTHGGVVLPDGSIAEASIDFATLKALSEAAKKKYGLAGAVQHGASTLPDDAFHHFPETDTAEIHLATGFQNMVYDHTALPEEFRKEVYNYLSCNFSEEKKEGQSETQFIYKTRKKGFGPLKRAWWDLPQDVKGPICDDLEEKLTFLFKKLNVTDSMQLVEDNVRIVPVHKKRPS